MSLKLYNTLTRKKQVFKPLKDNLVRIYGCGPTVYWYQHIGNMRRYIFEDLLIRILLANGFKIKHIINVTDVGHLTSDADTGEDKMEKAAKREGKNAREIADYYFKVFKEDLEKLNILKPDKWPRATEHIRGMIEFIEILKKKGYTYETSDGIYFDSSKLKDYGKLARLDIKTLKAGKRISIGEKRNKTDFALWKFSPETGEQRQQEWKAFGRMGFPGWHIECSVMSSKYLGKQFDIHTGGMDHIPVHHTNEIAQSEAAFGKKPWVNYWLHSAWLLFKGEKVSKSTGGAFTLSELEEKGFDALAFRYLCLLTHYRKPLNFTLENLEGASKSYQRLKNIISDLKKNEKANRKNIAMAKKQFIEFVNDDLNVPRGLAYLWEILRDERLRDAEKYEIAMEIDKVLGLQLGKQEKIKVPENIKKLVAEREKYRKEQEWKKADAIRGKIKKLGYVIDDTDEGARVKKE